MRPQTQTPATPRKNVIARRYYPIYYGRPNTYRSYRSYRVGGTVRPGSADQIVGTCDGAAPDGWVAGLRSPTGLPTRRMDAVERLPGWAA
jgi:hypothetical protein